MLAGFYSGVSGIYYNEQKLGVVSNNIANAETTGFHSNYLMFRTRKEQPGTAWIDPAAKKRLPDIYGMQREAVFQNTASGSIQQTGNPLDLTLAPELQNAFFSVKRTDLKDSETYYTRNGTLSVGKLDETNPSSPNILHIAGSIGTDSNGQPIVINPQAGALSVGADGIVRQGTAIIGQLGIYRLNKSADPAEITPANLQSLVRMGDSLYQIPPLLTNEFHPQIVEIGKNNVNRIVIQGARESSNVNIMNELVETMNITKDAAANQASIAMQADSLTKLFQLVRSG